MRSIAIISLCFASMLICADDANILQDLLGNRLSNGEKNQKKENKKEPKISFFFDNEDLVSVVNLVAEHRHINIVLPKDPIKEKVTLHIEKPLTLGQAWDLLQVILDLAGYALVPSPVGFSIKKVTRDIFREPLPLYVNVLPAPNQERVRYLHYLNNIRVSDAADSEVLAILRQVLSDNAHIKFDVGSNGILITDKASNIVSAIDILKVLDVPVYQEALQIIKLHYINPQLVETIFKQLITTATPPPMGIPQKPSEVNYFQNIVIVAEPRTNSLILRGKQQAIERVVHVIQTFLDVPLDSGRSVLHWYQLQYLDADVTAEVLRKLITTKTGGPEQAKGAEAEGGTERWFKDVIILSDKAKDAAGGEAVGKFYGNNNLVIAARTDDWIRIRNLLEQLDKPQPQVIIEVLIADLTMTDIRALGTSFRNPYGLPLPDLVNVQSAQTQQVILDDNTNPTTLQADLLRKAFDAAGAPGSTLSAAAFYPAGSGLLSLSDPNTGSTSAIGQIQKILGSTKILQHPHVIATQNQEALIKAEEQRFLPDAAQGGAGGASISTRKWIPATLEVKITPRISSAETVNISVSVTQNTFVSPVITSGDRKVREVRTNANIPSGAILALGGLSRLDVEDNENSVPLLSRIPLIGWLFKKRNNSQLKTMLTIFISPTIIMPRLRSGMSEYTRDYVNVAYSYTGESSSFDSLRDPITRWFFRPAGYEHGRMLDEYLSRDELLANEIIANNRFNKIGLETEQENVAPAPATETFIAAPKPTFGTMSPEDIERKRKLTELIADADNPFTSQEEIT